MHILTVDQFTRTDVEELCRRADELRYREKTGKQITSLSGKILTNLFYEASTRTSCSFQAAMYKLGGNVVSINDVNYSSVSKGENLEDTIRTMASYSDAIVLRHPRIGAAQRASLVSRVPVINAGDGAGEHPTQALLDLYTIWREQGQVDGLKIAMIGDLKNGRTVHSLSKLLRMWNTELILISPEMLSMPSQYVKDQDTEHHVVELLKDHVEDIDVLYVTRVQKERMMGGMDVTMPWSYNLTMDHMTSVKSTATIMHPLPRNEEIHPDIDNDPRAAYFRQMENGLWMRAALLEKVLTQV